MLSPFRIKKIKKLFWFWDADKNGFLEKKDYVLVGEKLSNERSWHDESPEKEFLIKKLLNGWAEAEKFADTNKDNRISLEEWLIFCDALTMDKDLYFITVTNIAAVIFDACDIDENGILEKDEWRLLFRIYGKTIENADESFAIITENERSLLNRDCVLNLLDDFFYSEDENKIGNYIFGSLE